MSTSEVSRTNRLRTGVAVWLSAAVCAITACSSATSQTPQPGAHRPERIVKLVFIHHSCGENWLADAHGGLSKALAANRYFVSDTNYGWGPDGIGDRTDITDWPAWFTGPHSAEYLEALYRESEQHSEYTRTVPDPGGENQIIIFKSCFPNSNLEGRPTDKPAHGEGLSVANAKAIYSELLEYFTTRPDRLFIVVTAPPVRDPTHAANASAFNTWLVQDWLALYRGKNVAVFDFYNVLTHPGNHHRVRNGKVEYVCQAGKNTLYYPINGDDHPSPAGNRKATEEFLPLLNYYYNLWAATNPKTALTEQPPANAPEREDSAGEPPATETRWPKGLAGDCG